MWVKNLRSLSQLILICNLVSIPKHLTTACPYYCTCSQSMNRCSDFEGNLPSADLMQASGGGGSEGGIRWDFSTGNNISVINVDSFEGLSDVTYLNLSHNNIEQIPDGAFKPLKNLQILDLSYNKLKSVRWRTFEGLRNLKVLNISHNLIWSYPDPHLFDNLTGLQVLSVANPFLFCQCSFLEGITQLKNRSLDSKKKQSQLNQKEPESEILISKDSICNDNLEPGMPLVDQLAIYSEARGENALLLNNRFSDSVDVCESDGQVELKLPIYELVPPSGTTQLVFEGDSVTLNCSVSLPSADLEVIWRHGDDEIARRKNKREEREMGVEAETWEHKAVTYFSIAITKLDIESHSGQWLCMIKSTLTGEMLLPSKSVHLIVMEHGALFCPRQTMKTTRGHLEWPKTIAGYQQALPCPLGRSSLSAKEPVATRTCSEEGQWGPVVLDVCEFMSHYSSQITQLYMKSQQVMAKLPQFGLPSSTDPDALDIEFEDQQTSGLSAAMLSIALQLSNVTSWSAVMENGEDVQYTALTVHNLFHFMNLTRNFDLTIIECLIDTVSNAMSFSPHLLLQSEESFHSCSMMTHYLHEAIFATVNQDTYTAVYRRNAHNIAIRAFKIHDVGSFTGYTCALLVSSSSSGSSSSKLTSFMGASFKTNAALECQDGVQQNVSTLRMGHSHINKLYAAVKVASPYKRAQTDEGESRGSSTSPKNRNDKFFKLQIVVFRNASLFPSADTAIVSPVASAKIDAVGSDLLSDNLKTELESTSSTAASIENRVLEKALSVDLALFYGTDGSEFELSSGGGFKLGTMTACTWMPVTKSDNRKLKGPGLGGVGVFGRHGAWVPTGNPSCRIVATRHSNVSEVQCDSLATVAVSTVLTPLDHSVQTVDAAVQMGCGTCIVFALLVCLTYIVFKSCIFATVKSIHVLINFCVAIFFLCLLFAFGNLFSQTSDSYMPESSAPVYLQSAYLFQKQQSRAVPYLACSLVFVALDYFLLSAALWLILFNRNLCRQFEKIEEKHGHQQLQHNQMGAAVTNSSGNAGGTGGGGGGSGGGAAKRQSALSSNKKQFTHPVYRFYLLCWGLPFIVCLSSSLVSLKFYARQTEGRQTSSGLFSMSSNNSMCWMSPTIAAITSFVPVGLCCIMCIVYMVKTLLIIPKLPRKLEVRQQCFNPTEHTHPNMCSNGPLYLDGELELSALTDNESMHSSVISPSIAANTETNNNRFSRQTNTSANGVQHNYVTATFSVKADSACCRQLRSALILFILFFASWLTAALLVFSDFHPDHRVNAFKAQISLLFAVSCTLLGMFLFLKFCLFRSDVKQCYIAFITCKQTASYPKPSQVTHSLYLKHHNSYLSLESGMNGGGSSHPSSYHPAMSMKQSLQNQTTSFTFSESISSDCVRNNAGAFYNAIDPFKNSNNARSHDKCRTVFPANMRNTTASSMSGSSVRGGIDDELVGITGDKAMHPSTSQQLQSLHHRSQNSLPENGVNGIQPWQQQLQQTSLNSSSEHDSTRMGVSSPLTMVQQVPYNTGVLAGRNTPVSIPPTPLGQPNKGPIHGKANYNPLLSNVAASPQFSPGGSNLANKQGPVDQFMNNRCHTPSSSLSQPPPDLLQSYYATRNAKLKSAARSNTSGGSSASQSRNQSQTRHKEGSRTPFDPVGASNVRDDSFSSDDSEDDDEDDESSLGREIDESLRSRFHPAASRHISNPGATSGSVNAAPSRPPKQGFTPQTSAPPNSNPPPPPRGDQGETSV
ncbi:uncharacterized protein LOC142336429 isoform X2 [Convolutriloba macropyga]|uniref:uncharacterized protein LOC142336429 isoform X2 n=1 Tax=Convolutriloba macropyga TaxID=536237 RepID=UPI003F527637